MIEPLLVPKARKKRCDSLEEIKEWISREIVRLIGQYNAPRDQDILNIERVVDHMVSVVGQLRMEFHGKGKAKAPKDLKFYLMEEAGDYTETNGTEP